MQIEPSANYAAIGDQVDLPLQLAAVTVSPGEMLLTCLCRQAVALRSPTQHVGIVTQRYANSASTVTTCHAKNRNV